MDASTNLPPLSLSLSCNQAGAAALASEQRFVYREQSGVPTKRKQLLDRTQNLSFSPTRHVRAIGKRATFRNPGDEHASIFFRRPLRHVDTNEETIPAPPFHRSTAVDGLSSDRVVVVSTFVCIERRKESLTTCRDSERTADFCSNISWPPWYD